jgi:predicted GNAT family acetyltransferase
MQRIELHIEGHIAVLDYSIEDDATLTIWHVETPPALRGRGIAGELVEKARALADMQQLALHPVCGFAKTYLARHPTAAATPQRDSSEPHA